MTGSHEARGSIPLSSTKKIKGLGQQGFAPFSLCGGFVPYLSRIFIFHGFPKQSGTSEKDTAPGFALRQKAIEVPTHAYHSSNR